MTRILCSYWLPELARWAYFAPILPPQEKKMAIIFNRLLNNFACWQEGLMVASFFFFRFYAHNKRNWPMELTLG